MKKTIIFLLFIFVLVFYLFISCSKNSETPSSPQPTIPPTPTNTFIPGTTPTNTLNPTSTPNPTTDNVSGYLYLPTPQPGRQFFVAADNDDDILNGSIAKMWGLCGMSAVVSYAFTVPSGNYFILAGVDISNTGFVYGPINGDYIGIYGGGAPVKLNVSSGQMSYANIWMTAIPTFTSTNTATFTNTPTVTPTTTGVISGSLMNAAVGVNYQIWVDTNLNPWDGFIAIKSDNVNSSTQSFTFNSINPGTYYVYAWINKGMDQISGMYINVNDQIGWYGSNYPSVPSAPNVSVMSGMTTGNINIQMKEITMIMLNYNVQTNYPTIPFGGTRQGACILDTNNNFSDGFSYIQIQTVSGNQSIFSIYVPFLGTYYIYAFIDMDNSGLEQGPSGSDYKGFFGPISLNVGQGGNVQINLN